MKIIGLLLLAPAITALQTVAPRRANPVVAPPTADLVLIDGDNVRGKTAFAVSAQSLLEQTRAFASTQDAVLYIDHGLSAECVSVEDNLRVVFAGTAQSADDCIVRDVAYLLEANPGLTVNVVTSDSGLIARCRKAARARGRNGRLDICGSVRFAETVLDDDIADDAPDLVTANDDHVAVALALQVSTARASLKRVRNKRLTKKRRRGAFNEVTSELASLNGLSNEPIATPDAALEALVDAGATRAELEAAIHKAGGGIRAREKTWERSVRAAHLHKHLRGDVVHEHAVLDGLATYVNTLMSSRALAREAVLTSQKMAPRLKPKRLSPLKVLQQTESVASKAWPGGWPCDLTVVETPRGAFVPDLVSCSLALVSDTHGFAIEDLPFAGDILIHAGDFWLDTANRKRNTEAFEAFDAWLHRQAFTHKIVLRGNHDPVRCAFPLSNATYVHSKRQTLTLNGLKVYCAPHGTYAMAKDPRSLKELAECDVLLTHAPPRGTLDETYEGNNAGAKALRDAYYVACDESAPTLWICGHIHEAAGAARVGQTTIINAAAANAGRAKRLDRGFVAVGAGVVETPSPPPPPPVVVVEDTAPVRLGPERPRLLAVDLGEKVVGVALYDEQGALLSFAAASDEENGSQAVACAAAWCLGDERATVVVCEGTGRRLADEAFKALQERDLVNCAAPHVINPDEWRAAVLAPRERADAKKAKHAARLVARQLAGALEAWGEDLTTDSAEACVVGAWAATELGWRSEAVAERFSNGDLRLVAKRPIIRDVAA